MKAIAKPPHRRRTDVNFAPPADFELPATRYVDVPREHQAAYSPDEVDRRFIERCEAIRLCDPPLTLHALCILMAALEVQAFRDTGALLEKHQRDAAAAAAAGRPHQQFQSALSLMTASNRDQLMKVKIDIPTVLRNGVADDSSSDGPHPLVSLSSNSPTLKKVHDAVHGHWVEKRCALGTALCPQLRFNPIDGGAMNNSVLGEEDDPFFDRDIRDVLVVWRESPAHTYHAKMAKHDQQNPQQPMPKKAKSALRKELRKLTDTADGDRATLRRLLVSAKALMEAVVQREELRAEHVEATIAELALARRCRQLPVSAFQQQQQQSGAATPALTGTSKKAREHQQQQIQQQQAALAAQFQASQQLVPLVSSTSAQQQQQSKSAAASSPLSAPLQGAQLRSVVDELSSRFGLF